MEIAVIIGNNIVFCSNEDDYPKFEIIFFTYQLIQQLKEERSWKIHKLTMFDLKRERPIKILTMERDNAIFCLLGGEEFDKGSLMGYTYLEELHATLSKKCDFANYENFSMEEKKDFFIVLKTYKSLMDKSAFKQMFDEETTHQYHGEGNALIYAGISSSGLPILSNLYDGQEFLKFTDAGRKELTISLLSGQLATIAINSFIRAQCLISQIQINMDNDYLTLLFKAFGKDYKYTFEIFSTGDPQKIIEAMDKTVEQLDNSDIFGQDFAGQLVTYKPARQYFEFLSEKLN